MSAATNEAQPVAWLELWRILLEPRPDVFAEPEDQPTQSDDNQDESA
jgi:hypothetical protein